MAPLITLTTDFGQRGPFVAVMKGVILDRAPGVVIVDLMHDIPVHWPIEAGFWLARAYRYFPAGSIHVAVVDPGVGTTRDILAAEHDGHVFLGPDNGLLAPVIGEKPACCHRLAERWRSAQGWPAPSSTFHGRDIFAPLAAELAAGRVKLPDIGPRVAEIAPAALEAAALGEQEVRGTVVTIDTFGNLITNIEAGMLARFRKPEVLTGGHRLPLRRTYGDTSPGEFLALINSFGVLEIARAEGSAADGLGLGRGAPVIVTNATR